MIRSTSLPTFSPGSCVPFSGHQITGAPDAVRRTYSSMPSTLVRAAPSVQNFRAAAEASSPPKPITGAPPSASRRTLASSASGQSAASRSTSGFLPSHFASARPEVTKPIGRPFFTSGS